MSGGPPQDDDGNAQSFRARRDKARADLDAIDRGSVHDGPERKAFFNTVYARAGGDAAQVPWADLAPKRELLQWLEQNSGISSSSASGALKTAIDIACGLGDNAEALAAAGYRTSAFDLSRDAIDWARRRFPDSAVEYRQADLFDLPTEWRGAFDLIHECYTLQSMPPEMIDRVARSIAALAAPGGDLLIYARWRPDGTAADGPPWPLADSQLDVFAPLGFERVGDLRFELLRPGGRLVPHAFVHWRKR
ncbi:MAG: class I SAM-dependent methyltransferase [Nitratireductor sp.]|nr:class I SAM-dependent methyltransferase [Nitratireductor sp.]